jgi:predicted nuclease of restriction endonuclease-like (RecB) superfamily
VFYEIECIRGNWSVRELKRQINSLYYERSGLSKNKKKLQELAKAGAESALAGMDNHLFVSKYLLAMPKKEEMQRFLEEQIKPEV